MDPSREPGRVDPTLPYARPRRRRSGWLIPSLIGIAVIVGWYLILVAGRPAWQRVSRQFKMVSLWERCNAIIAPSQQIVWEEDPEAVDVLLTDPHYDAVERPNAPPAAMRLAGADEWALVQLLGRVPSGATLFIHERTATQEMSTDKRQLVIVELISTRGDARRAPNLWTFNASSIGPGALGEFEVRASNISLEVPAWITQTRRSIRFYAGQPDLFDRSHFEIGYGVDADQGAIDGWLTENGRVILQIRDGPAVDPQEVVPSDNQ